MKKLYIVGLGPGGKDGMTARAFAALEASEVLCGYSAYIDLVREQFPEKEFYTTPMHRELERCRWAVEAAESGKTIAMLCSGDAGVYGMAAPCLEAAEGKEIEIEIVPGVTAALSGAALLGAPLTNDFCVISLSNLLTPWETIERRLEAAGIGDFCVCLYNPMSRSRREQLRLACEILLRYKSGNTVCGIARNIGRAGEEARLLTLKELRDAEADMFTIVFIGNASTRIIDGRMITERGYQRRET